MTVTWDQFGNAQTDMQGNPLPNLDRQWRACLDELSLTDATYIAESRLDPARRVYRRDDTIYKIVLVSHEWTSCYRANTPQQEREIIGRCGGVRGVPTVLGSQSTAEYEVTMLEVIPGETLASLDRSFLKDTAQLLRVVRLLFDLSLRGVIHDDLTLDNIIIGPDNRANLIDFDQAKFDTKINALRKNLFGSLRSKKTWESPMTRLAKHTYRSGFKSFTRRITNSIKKRLGRRTIPDIDPNGAMRRLPDIPEGADQSLQKLRKAWELAKISDANYPGGCVAYYELEKDGYVFPGERPWAERWEQFKSVTSYKGKRVLELGCNLSLLSCYLQQFADAAECACVDHDADILVAARLVSEALGTPCEYHQIDFDKTPDWEEPLAAFKPNIVTALSVLNWVEDKQRLMNFLGRFDEVIFEGHDSSDTEKQRFYQQGFVSVTELVSPDRDRPILHCQKQIAVDRQTA